MKLLKNLLLICLCFQFTNSLAQEKNTDYIEFNDNKNILHGVYMGLAAQYGQINNENAYFASVKIAYVANQQFEVGVVGKLFYSEQDNIQLNNYDDLYGAYGGIHLEPILFSKSKFNLSFPILLGAGATTFIDDWSEDFDDRYTKDDWDVFVIAETGANLLYNISRYVQVEAGISYRFSSKINLVPNDIKNINGLSGGIGIKVGVFNIGRNRHKKI